MGGGSYNYTRAHSRSAVNSYRSNAEIFSQRTISSEMDIRGKVREARDSEEHPESFPIIIALDTTGSMGDIPRDLVTNSLPAIMKTTIDAGIPHPQLCFLGVGDAYYDKCPIQCGQFESSDELMEKWLKLVYLEGGGGGNGGESYNLAWYFAARHTSIDSFIKRKQKGVLITIGDEPCHKALSKSGIERFFGDSVEGDMTSTQLLEKVREQWNPFHIQMGDGQWDYSVIKGWEALIGKENLIVLPREDYKLIPVITSVICKVYGVNSSTLDAKVLDNRITDTGVTDTEDKKENKITL